MSAPSRVLVVRNDKLGDFVLALPACEALKRAFPGCRVTALVPEYTREVAELAPGIDDVLIDPGPDADGGSSRALARRIRAERFDASLTLWSTTRVGLALFLARVPRRYAPATKWAQVFHDRRVRQRRSESVQPEYEYNLDLARRLIADHGVTGEFPLRRPVLAFPPDEVAARRAELLAEHGLDEGTALVALHAGHGGSANNLSVEQYARLANAIPGDRPRAFLCTAGPGEEDAAADLARRIDAAPAALQRSTAGLRAFTRTLAAVDLFVGGSTGPLHLAGALDRPTAAFYPRRRTSSPLRWQAMNDDAVRLAWAPPEPAHERDLSAIDLDAAAREIGALLSRTR